MNIYITNYCHHSFTVECQSQLSSAVEKERNAVEKELTFQARVSALETQLTSLRQERSQLLASLELERAKLETLEEGQQRYIHFHLQVKGYI